MNPQALADRWLRPDLIRPFAGTVLTLVAAMMVVSYAGSTRNRTPFGTNLGGDYAEFHAVGLIRDGGRLYDLDLQDERLHQVLPAMPADEHLPFAYPPFAATPFRWLARLPFPASLATWQALTLAAYSAAVALMLREFPKAGRSTAWLLALSFEPFAAECWLGGQLSAIGCLAVAAALRLKGRRPVLAGLALSALLYKPTLPLLILPLLVVGRRWAMLGGFALGAAGLGAASLAIAGGSACLDFARLLAGYGTGGGSVALGFKTAKYVDLRAFLRLLGVGTAWAIPLALPPLAGLVVAWNRARDDRGPAADLAWAASLCWTPVLNLYGPIYDVSLVVPALIPAARTMGGATLPMPFRWLVAFLYLAALLSPSMAGGIGFQPLTVSLAATGAYLTRESLRSAITPRPA